MIRPLHTAAIVALLAASFAPSRAAAGPWTKSFGELYVQLGEGFFLSDSYTDASGQTVAGTDYFSAATQLYFEVGLPLGFQVQGFIPYVIARNAFDDGADFVQGGGGDARLAVQYRPPLLENFPWALRIETKLPLYDVGRLNDDPLQSRYPVAGDGQVDVTFWLTVGGGLPNAPLFAYFEIGYELRTGAYIGEGSRTPRDFGDGIAFNASVGYTLFNRVLIKLDAIGVIAPAPSGDTWTKSFIVLGPGVLVDVAAGFSIVANYLPVVFAKQSAPGHGFGLAVAYKR